MRALLTGEKGRDRRRASQPPVRSERTCGHAEEKEKEEEEEEKEANMHNGGGGEGRIGRAGGYRHNIRSVIWPAPIAVHGRLHGCFLYRENIDWSRNTVIPTILLRSMANVRHAVLFSGTDPWLFLSFYVNARAPPLSTLALLTTYSRIMNNVTNTRTTNMQAVAGSTPTRKCDYFAELALIKCFPNRR